MSTDVVISFDTTGSMSPCIAEVRQRVEQTINKLFDTIDDLRIGLLSHGDYCDEDASLDFIGLTNDRKELVRFVRNARNTSGGDSDEFYEYVLHVVNSAFEWNADKKALIFIADAMPHEVGYVYKNIRYTWDWVAEAKRMAERGIMIYAVEALGSRNSRSFYEPLAYMTNGRKLDLSQFTDAVDTITAISYHASGEEGLLKNMRNDIEVERRMNRSLAAMFHALDTDAKVSAEDHSGLKPVPPARFQVVTVDRSMDIRSFVQSIGARFNKGRGFYQFTKSETVQEYKEVVLRNRYTGDMFTGAEARIFIGLPYGERGTIRPHYFEEYEVFIQSTSVNRRLIAGTKFLYENEMK